VKDVVVVVAVVVVVVVVVVVAARIARGSMMEPKIPRSLLFLCITLLVL
jgi:hypothetical protein